MRNGIWEWERVINQYSLFLMWQQSGKEGPVEPAKDQRTEGEYPMYDKPA